MTITKKHLLLTALILTAITSPAYPEPNQSPTPKVEFKISQLKIKGWPDYEYSNSAPLPTHIAAVYAKNVNYVTGGGKRFARRRDRRPAGSPVNIRELNRVLRSAFEESISQQQKHFNNLNEFVTLSDRGGGEFLTLREREFGSSHPRGPNWEHNTKFFAVHGVSVEDTKTMVKALIKWADDKAYARLESRKNVLERLRKKKPLLQAEVGKLEQAVQDTDKKCEQLKATSFYKTLGPAQTALQEFNKTCQLLEIEIADIKAKLDVIRQAVAPYVEGRRATPDFIMEKRLNEEIALAGALARLQAAEGFRNAASAVIDCMHELERLANTLPRKKKESKRNASAIISVEKELADPVPHQRPVEIVGKVIIYPRQSSEEE